MNSEFHGLHFIAKFYSFTNGFIRWCLVIDDFSCTNIGNLFCSTKCKMEPYVVLLTY